MVLIYLFGGNGKSVRESEWNERLKEMLDGRESGRTAIEGRGRVCLTTDYTYILTWVLCIAFCICPDSPLSGLSFSGSHRRNIETKEHPDHLRCHRRGHSLVWGTAVTLSVHSLFIHPFFINAYFGAMKSCFLSRKVGGSKVAAPQLCHLCNCAVVYRKDFTL